MVQISTLLSALTAMAVAGSAFAHSGPPSASELQFKRNAKRSLTACQSQLRKRDGYVERAIARRQARAESIRKARGLPIATPFKRDFPGVLATDHHSNLTGVTNDTDPSVLFDSRSTCVLAPEVTQGPYLVDGEFVRFDVTEDQSGVPTYLDIELLDVNTCEPVANTYIDIWACNATGVYSGVVANGNGNSASSENINATFLRGIQQTDEDGVAQWLTVFPGHYTGRTNHIHVMAHQSNGTLFDNGTYVGDYVSHVGQVFFDQSLISEVEATSPYTSNTQNLTTNEEDGIMEQEADTIDPVVEYVLLGDSITDGIFAWSSMAIDTSSGYTVTPAVDYYETGGVTVSGGGGGPGGPPPSA